MSAERAVSIPEQSTLASHVHGAGDEASNTSGYLASENFSHLKQANIMMVDDEQITMLVLQSFLQEAGYSKFHLVSDSATALSELRQQRPDILLLDVVMPGVSGFDILSELRAQPELSHLPVIILTSSSDAETKLRALDLGATDFLAKPVDSSELALRVRNTLAAKAYQDQLAYYDALTNLPNGHLFQERLNWAIERADADNGNVTLVHIVFEEFKRVADTFGPKVGDEVVKELASRLSREVRLPGIAIGDAVDGKGWIQVFCLGGAEFFLLLPTVADVEIVSKLGGSIIAALGQSIDADGTEVYLVPSVGIAGYPEDTLEPETLTRFAMSASSQAVTQGGGRLQFYSASMNERSVVRIRMEANLRRALAKNEFLLFYQPKVSVSSGELIGAEALIRWFDKDVGIVSPADFIPVAEDTGLILPIGEWVMREACRQYSVWREQGIDMKMSINVSARQFFEADLVSLVDSLILEYGIDPSRLVLEMTESILVDKVDKALALLAELRDLGVQISIDDFGTGYSSLSYLKLFRANEVKIDRAFINDVVTSREDQALVYAITYLAHEMDFTVCAEGVENKEQEDYLRTVKCDEYQGFYFSRPLSASDFAALYIAKQEERPKAA